MIDSAASLPSGILTSTITQLGDFDQCVAIDGEFGHKPFVGKYCLATVNLPRAAYDPIVVNATTLKPSWIGKYIEQWHHLDNRYPLAVGICFPSICHQNEIKDILKSCMYAFAMPIILLQYSYLPDYKVLQSFEFNVTYCQSREDPPQYDSRLWIAVYVQVMCLAYFVKSL